MKYIENIWRHILKNLQLLNMDENSRKIYMQEKGSSFIKEFIENIGTTDEKERNEYIQLFTELLTTNLLCKELKLELIRKLTDENSLFYQLGEKNTDSIYTRAYSAFYLSMLLQSDLSQPFLTETTAKSIIENCLPYLSKEQDIHRDIEGKGWANTIYFGANLYTSMIQHPTFEEKFRPIVLQGIKDCFWKGTVFIHDEEEQLVKIVAHLINQNIKEDLLIEWVEQIFDKLYFYELEVGYTSLYYAARTNILHFMKTLYFTLKFSRKMPELKGVASIFIGKSMG